MPSRLKGDPYRLRQILINLVGNSIKFTEKGEVSITVSVDKETQNSATFQFEVTDTGIGIPKDRIPILFDSFSQVDASTTRKYGGTGLGLAISKQIVELMGGEIGVVSEEGKGTTFLLKAIFEKQENIPDEKNIIKDIENKKILIVANNATGRKVFSEHLKSWNCIFEEAATAEQALLTLRSASENKNPFLAAIIDKQVKGIDDFSKKIQASQNICETIIIIVVLPGQKEDAEKMKDAGFAAYLTKPIKKSQLFDCILTLPFPESKKKIKKQLMARHAAKENKAIESASAEPLRILLAEDNKMNQKVAINMLKKLGHTVTIAENGLEAVDAFHKNKFDLILMDGQMPEMDGIEATAKIRKAKDETKRQIPIIALTADAMKTDQERFLKAGMDDYIAKPVKRKTLAEVIARCMARSM